MSANFWATLVSPIITKNFQRKPNLVTLHSSKRASESECNNDALTDKNFVILASSRCSSSLKGISVPWKSVSPEISKFPLKKIRV